MMDIKDYEVGDTSKPSFWDTLITPRVFWFTYVGMLLGIILAILYSL